MAKFDIVGTINNQTYKVNLQYEDSDFTRLLVWAREQYKANLKLDKLPDDSVILDYIFDRSLKELTEQCVADERSTAQAQIHQTYKEIKRTK